jgi:hypothetical protein
MPHLQQPLLQTVVAVAVVEAVMDRKMMMVQTVVQVSLSFDTQYRSNKWHILQKYKMAS